MTISLTQEEFLERLLARQPLLKIAIDEDYKAISLPYEWIELHHS